MKKLLAVFVLATTLAACGTITNVSSKIEQVDTFVADSYVTVSQSVNAYELTTGADTPKAESIRLQAWRIFIDEHHLYLQGQLAQDAVKNISDLVKQASQLGRTP